MKSHPETSNYTLNLPNEPDCFFTFHTLQLKKFVANDSNLFLSRTLPRPGPVVTTDGEQEWLIDKITDEHVWGRSHQYLVRWMGWGPEEDRWLPGREMTDMAALDVWLT